MTLLPNSQDMNDTEIETAADCPNVTLEMMLREEDNPTCPYNYTIVVSDVTDQKAPQLLEYATVTVEFTREQNGRNHVVNYGPLYTNNKGKVTLLMNAHGEFKIRVEKEGYQAGTNQATVEHCKLKADVQKCEPCDPFPEECFPFPECVSNEPEGPTTPVTVQLEHCEIPFPVTVRNARTKEPIMMAQVNMIALPDPTNPTSIMPSMKFGMTDANGVVTFNDVVANFMYIVSVSADNYVAGQPVHPILCDPRECGECQTDLTVDLKETFCENAKMTLWVRDPFDNNKAAKGAKIFVDRETQSGKVHVWNGTVGDNPMLTFNIKDRGVHVVEVTGCGNPPVKTETKLIVEMDAGGNI